MQVGPSARFSLNLSTEDLFYITKLPWSVIITVAQQSLDGLPRDLVVETLFEFWSYL